VNRQYEVPITELPEELSVEDEATTEVEMTTDVEVEETTADVNALVDEERKLVHVYEPLPSTSKPCKLCHLLDKKRESSSILFRNI